MSSDAGRETLVATVSLWFVILRLKAEESLFVAGVMRFFASAALRLLRNNILDELDAHGSPSFRASGARPGIQAEKPGFPPPRE
jgi:hypothetical protein